MEHCTSNHRDPLFGEEAHIALKGLGPERDPLRVATRLRASLEPELARRCAELHELRLRARSRFCNEIPLFMTVPGLSRASSEAAANARAARIFTRLPRAWVSDATCGIGADSMALSRAGLRVLASDLDPHLAACASANLSAYGHAARVVVADCLHLSNACDALILDPDRRAGGTRTLNPERWSPSLTEAIGLAHRYEGACLKLAPAMEADAVELPHDLPHHWQWVSVDHSLVELCLWTGALSSPVAREATLVRRGEVMAQFTGEPVPTNPIPKEQLVEPPYLHDPDPCLVRSRLLGTLAAELGLRALHPMLALLVGDAPASTPFLASFRVLGSAPLDRRRVRDLLRAHDVGPIEIRKRGHPDPAEELARRFKGPGERRGTLFVTRLDKGHRAYLAEPSSGPVVGDEGLEPTASSL